MSTNTKTNAFRLSVMTLAIMNITAVVSLRGLATEAIYGLASAFYYLFAAIVFLIPTAMVAAELAAMFANKQGGVFRWVGEAFGARVGFLAIWLQWIQSTIWYPTVLTFGAVSIAFIGMDQSADEVLASNRLFTLVVVLAIYWVATFISLRGLGWVGKVSKWGGIIGTIIPAALLILLAIVYLAVGGTNNLNMKESFFPDLTNFNNLVLASSIFLFYAGMEMMGIHVMDVDNPKRNYPRAIIIGSLVTVLIFILGTFSLGIVVPTKEISLTQTLLIGFDNYFNYLKVSWMGPIIAIALVFGVLAGVLTWVAGPSKGIFAVGRAGYLPPFFQKTNNNGVQRNILLVQGVIVTILGLLFVVMPSVQSFYQILSQLTVLLYLIMYMLMFSSAIVLRYKLPQMERPFRLGAKGNGLIWILAGLGFCGSLLAFVLSFIPPSQISVGSNAVWYAVLIIGAVIFVGIPFIIYAMRKPSWKAADADFEKFEWEK
ncbi:MAG: amino acid permease [Alistipes sp.]|nr:amino acid permease [Alistipes sp.]MBR5586172.1 amino acid permease [Alistipes sp.]